MRPVRGGSGHDSEGFGEGGRPHGIDVDGSYGEMDGDGGGQGGDETSGKGGGMVGGSGGCFFGEYGGIDWLGLSIWDHFAFDSGLEIAIVGFGSRGKAAGFVANCKVT